MYVAASLQSRTAARFVDDDWGPHWSYGSEGGETTPAAASQDARRQLSRHDWRTIVGCNKTIEVLEGPENSVRHTGDQL